MDLYFSPLACSLSARILLREADIPARFVPVDLKTKTLPGGESFFDINPMGQVPTLRTEDGRLLTENAAILEHLGERTGLAGADRDGLRRWLSFIATELHKGTFYPLMSPASNDGAREFALSGADARFKVLDDHLRGRPFLLDAFGPADAYLVAVLNWTVVTPVDLDRWAEVSRYRREMLARPAIAAAIGEERALYAAA